MTKIMTETCNFNAQAVCVSDVQLRLLCTNTINKLPGKMADPQRVLEAATGSTGKDVVHTTQLAYISEPLKLRSIDDFNTKTRDLNMTMHRIIKYFVWWP